jgi:bile acid:Na+ symporter, BASS family
LSVAALVSLILKTSIALNVFALGLKATPADVTYLVRRPKLLVRSLFSIYGVVPLVAVLAALLLKLRPPVEISLLALAISPVPPKMPRKAKHLPRAGAYAVGLVVVLSLLSLLCVPLGVEGFGKLFGFQIHQGATPLLGLVIGTTLGPLLLGMLLAYYRPKRAGQFERPIAILSTVLLAAAVVPVLLASGQAVLSLAGSRALVAIAAFILVGLAAGNLLGGPTPNDRAVLAVSSAFRHPGIAMTIAASTFPAQKLVPAAIILYVLVGALASQAYLLWQWQRYRSHEVA